MDVAVGMVACDNRDTLRFASIPLVRIRTIASLQYIEPLIFLVARWRRSLLALLDRRRANRQGKAQKDHDEEDGQQGKEQRPAPVSLFFDMPGRLYRSRE